jgi:hypothetical protein
MKTAQSDSEEYYAYNPSCSADFYTMKSEIKEDTSNHPPDFEDGTPSNASSYSDDKSLNASDASANNLLCVEIALAARKAMFYAEDDKRMEATSQEQRSKHIISDDHFNDIKKFVLPSKQLITRKKFTS